ncbi:MFS family permease [Lipingzhangella halophila]|uniref:MFS family permease n=1 Tax=Lipingzhangella halophila TaxID=1783352 RepID=A0A7W7W5I7_9ACTN|nr:MFS transporter [Lipingzhangella halophila]MBB4935292.1 MFS family permease [Lipingzhangella halophila]
MATADQVDHAQPLDPRAKRAVRGAFVGFFLDMYDIYLPVVALSAAMAYFVAPTMPKPTAAIVGSLIFVATLLGRPVGALLFGRYADRVGRKRTNLIAVSGFGTMSFLMAALPGYYEWGISAVILFIVLRFIDGVFVGGSYSASSPLAMEYLPRQKRGYWGAYIMVGFPLAFVAISVITLLTQQIAPVGGIDSAYVQWGWRIPFVIGGLISLIYVVWYAKNVDESELFRASGGTKSPLKTLFSGDSLKSFLQVFVLMSGFWLSLNTVSAIMPGLLADPVGLSGTESNALLGVAYLVLAGGYVAAGVVSQKTGRRPFLMVSGAAAAIIGTPLYYVLLTSPPDSTVLLIALVTAIVLVIVWFWGLATTYINERFQTGVRASGFGLGYSLAVIPPSFYAFYQSQLDRFMPFDLTVLPLLVVGGILVVIGAAIGPETRDVEFNVDKQS